MSEKRVYRKLAARVLNFLKPYAGFILASLILAVVVVAGTLLAPVLSGRGIDLIVGPGNVDLEGLARIAVRFGVVIAVTAASQWFMGQVNNHITFRVVRDLRALAFAKVERLPISYFDTHKPGDVVSRFTADADQLSDGLLMGFSQLFTGVITIAGTLVLMLSIEWRIAVAVVVLTPISIFVARFIARKSFRLFLKQSESRAKMTAFTEEYTGEAKQIRAFGYEPRAEARFDEINDELAERGLKATFFSSIVNPTTRFVNAIVYAVVGLLGAYMAVHGRISVGELVVVLAYANQYTRPFNDISNVLAELQNALACAARIFEFADEPEEEPDPVGAPEMPAEPAAIRFDDVDFGYLPGQKVIGGLNLTVAPGEHIAMVGRTGCGKTTLMNLLMRFYDPTSGEISIGGIPVRSVTRRSLRGQFAMVLQDTWLKDGTVAENIAYGRPDAKPEEIVRAAERARADSFIRRLPQGYETVLTGGGAGLSDGQKQLLCIARAMLVDAPVLILDEATSSIDTRTEVLVQEAFDELMRGRTSLVVAHRISTIRNADRILVMDRGHIVEQGDHETLLAAGGFYAQLYESQFAGNAT